jgi:orotidine-5'-phosphate decarboxylase
MNPIILALDTDDISLAHALVEKTRDHIGMIKIGTELWAAYGPKALELGAMHSIPVFLDLKLHDIPSTVGKTIDVIVNRHSQICDIRFLSVHAFGCKKMLSTAVSAARASSIKIAGVTVLTSLDYPDLQWLGFTDCRENIKTKDLAVGAWDAGVRTFVCSPKNGKLMRKYLDDVGTGDKCELITPGIRPDGSPEDDQKRTTSINEAIKNGSNWLVIGRPITAAVDPLDAAKDLSDQANKAINKWGAP